MKSCRAESTLTNPLECASEIGYLLLANCLILTSWNWDKSRQERIYLWQLPITLPGPNDHAMNV